MGRFRKVRDLTGRAVTGQFGIGGTDLGIVVTLPNGELLSVFGDTFENDTVGGPGWRSPVGLLGRIDPGGEIVWTAAAGSNPSYATKWWEYIQGGAAFSTVLPTDVVVVGNCVYLHVMVNKGLGNVLWTEVWRSTDNARTFQHLYKIDAAEDSGHAQMWTWDYNPEDGYVYAMTTGFQRDKGLRLRRIKADRMEDRTAWEKWGWHGDRWAWGGHVSEILPGRFGELSLRRLAAGEWALAFFNAGEYRIDVLTFADPTSNLHTARRETPLVGGAWGAEDHEDGVVAQLYGGYIVPGSRADVEDGFSLVVSQWNTGTNWPYRAMQFRGTVGEIIVPEAPPVGGEPVVPTAPDPAEDPAPAPGAPGSGLAALVAGFRKLFGW